jgi:hypothetical protein
LNFDVGVLFHELRGKRFMKTGKTGVAVKHIQGDWGLGQSGGYQAGGQSQSGRDFVKPFHV